MFHQVPQPLCYAEALLQHFASLARAANSDVLLGGLVEACTQLSGCALSQLYLLDDTHTRLTLSAEWQDGLLQSRAEASLPSDYDGEQLLQYCLCQNQVLCLDELDSSLQQIGFLPDAAQAWRSLLCLPLLDEQKCVNGLLLIASRESSNLHGFAGSLGHLGSFVIAQLHMLQRLRASPPEHAPIPVAPPCTSGYGLLGDSAPMRELYQMIGKVLHNPVSVLLIGETGTGKELVARAIHDCGFRRSRPFVVQNCASLPENLLESELFGYRKGAFTGADRDHQGLFDAAHGGTLLLDEIGDMPLALQAKLLRVLQEGEVRPLGCSKTHKVDVRIVAATHCDLHAQVEAGRFREDLFYRLAQFPIELPALRQRDQDILTLARSFAEKASAFLQRDPCRWADSTLEHLASYAFPGNVRELKGLVERAVLLCEGGELLPEHFNLRQDSNTDAHGMHLRERMERVERSLLLDCLRKNHGNQTSAAGELGLPRRTLLYRMQRLNISPADV
ncbi:sigma 54-interacting transcriptional regulator [Pseudomonas sp. sp1636]|uniref:sigma-54 interaction domain-containing protein n=1 Tax=Pseudomonas sp. sp1636 TaxID=3036707 RepID=UPI0025A4D04C|nr:sigma 54-interacting transcriptional regulator [Pseudomonas sp. sp1636]MDM8348550.1 sigma 54-interacting transcriptional regulator [Pseudomonas sp. sp1636]